MSESHMRREVCRALKPLHAVAVENPIRPGFPDICYADGLLELKHVRKWPTSGEAPLAVPHYTPQQRLFHRKRAKAGGRMFVVLQVGREWLLFRAVDAADRLGFASRRELLELAILKFAHPRELLPWLTHLQR